jgi:hypothetical protein
MDSKDSAGMEDPGCTHAKCTHSHGGPIDLKRRGAVRTSLSALLGGITALTVGALGAKKAHAGYGKCYKCECRAFEGSTYQCSNCGHQYSDHG